jgi:hypothetical protein
VNLSPTASLSGLRIYGPHIGSGAGTSVASAGDMNGDGRADIALGAPGTAPAYVPKGPRTPGAAYVVYARTKPGIIDLAKLGAGGFSFRGAGLGDRTGDSIAAGPLGTRDPQLVVGAPRAHNLRGAVYVVPPVPVLVSDRSIRVSRSGRASVTLRCVASARCSAIVEIHSLASGRLIGRRAYSVNSGSTRTKQIKLTSAGLRELRRTGKLRVSVAALTPKQTRSGGNTLSTATLTLLSPR